MIQDISPSKFNNSYKVCQPDSSSRFFIFSEDKLLADTSLENGDIIFPGNNDIPSADNAVYLFSIDDISYFLISDHKCSENGNFRFVPFKELRQLKISRNNSLFAAFTAYHLWCWYRSSRFCGKCGHTTVHSSRERAMVCPECGNTIYPRINPAVIIGVLNGDRILITRYRTGYAHNALVAGFTEIGESLEETVAREVMEEAGLRVKNIRYYKSQPWGSASDLLMGFFCDVDGSDEIHMDKSELKYAEWIGRDEIILQPQDISLTNEMMKLFRSGKI